MTDENNARKSTGFKVIDDFFARPENADLSDLNRDEVIVRAENMNNVAVAEARLQAAANQVRAHSEVVRERVIAAYKAEHPPAPEPPKATAAEGCTLADYSAMRRKQNNSVAAGTE